MCAVQGEVRVLRTRVCDISNATARRPKSRSRRSAFHAATPSNPDSSHRAQPPSPLPATLGFRVVVCSRFLVRRLRLKYEHHARTKSFIKTPHDQRLFFIARRIWGKRQTIPKTPKRHREEAKKERQLRTRSVYEEEFVAVTEELCGALPRNGVWKKGLGREIVRGFNEQWVLLKRDEAELMTRKAEFVNELIHLVVDAQKRIKTT